MERVVVTRFAGTVGQLRRLLEVQRTYVSVDPDSCRKVGRGDLNTRYHVIGVDGAELAWSSS